MSTGWNNSKAIPLSPCIINLLGNEYWLEQQKVSDMSAVDYKPTGK